MEDWKVIALTIIGAAATIAATYYFAIFLLIYWRGA